MRLNKGLLNASQIKGSRVNNILDIKLGNERDNTFLFYENNGDIITYSGMVRRNLIEVKSTNLNSNPNNGGYIKVNGNTVASDTINMPRGHTLVIIDSVGNTISVNTYDTYGNIDVNCNLLSSDLISVPVGYTVIIATWDATGINNTLRNTLKTVYGATSNITWNVIRRSHIFVGVKK